MAESVISREICEAPEIVGRQEQGLRAPIAALVARLAGAPPRYVVTCARGSSAHAATFAKHLVERYFGISVAPAAPNIATIYRRDVRLDGALFLTISQSGTSDDLVETARSAKRGGALTAALLNAPDSPLAQACDIVLPVGAGPESSVAATKSFVATLAALLRLVCAWGGDAVLEAAIRRLPQRLGDASALDWGRGAQALCLAPDLMVLGRGPTLAIAREAALKLKEVCDIHAEAFSGAEFRHGPMALVRRSYPVMMFMPGDAAAEGMRALARDLEAMGAAIFVIEPGAGASTRLPALAPDHPEADAITMIQSFYVLAVALAQLRGIDPDRPRHLLKTTRTR
jgi:glutamine---fructose-6-phosphate transaminase (isomerizing)